MNRDEEINLHIENMRRIKALQDQIDCNFPGSTPQERDKIIGLIACVYGRERKEIKRLESEIASNKN